MLPTDPIQKEVSPKKKLSDRDSFIMAFGVYGAVGFQLVASLLAGVFLGQWLDKKWGTDPWMMFVGLILGTGGGFYNLFRLVSWKNKKK
jgi:F0F1-type ATP synthase assembly protein I